MSFAMSTLVITPCLADANPGAVCYHLPLSQQMRGLCLGSTSPQQLKTCANTLRSSLGLRRGFVRGSKLTWRSMQGPRADSETDERPSRADSGNGRVGGLDELDNQLRSLSSSDNLMSAAKEADKGINVEELPRKERKKVDWPVFGEGFVLYISAGLILLTIMNNLLFRLFLGPPVPRVPLTQGSTEGSREFQAQEERRERYKLRSYNDPKYLQKIAPAPATDEPVS